MRVLSIWPCLVFSLWALPSDAAFLADRSIPEECPEPDNTDAAPLSPAADVMEELLSWIEAQTAYDVSALRNSPPEISFCAVGERIPYEAGSALVDVALNGAYDHLRNTILLVQPWNPDDPRDRSVLLHELLHAAQLQNRTYACLEEAEWEAYRLQEAYLAERGLESGFDWLQIYFWSQCPRDIHPD
ncbi:MAG: hypothetical protein QNJ20_19550 [Paracoccaceae bacterium]|nr:hypothetical protein [Paracoccaceae bacterium]